jgi:outer membrane lipoprotein
MTAAGVFTALLASQGCAPPFPKELLEKVDRKVSFTALQKEPGAYEGRLVMLGGMIIEAKNQAEGTLIEVLEKPLDSEGKPRQTDESGGRFLVTTGNFLDAAVYHTGRMITVVGTVSGQRTLKLGEIEYRYPLIAAKDQYLWRPYSSGPRFFFGIGVTKHL